MLVVQGAGVVIVEDFVGAGDVFEFDFCFGSLVVGDFVGVGC